MPVFLTRSLLSHVNTAQVVHSTALRPRNVFIAWLASWLGGWVVGFMQGKIEEGMEGELDK